MARSFTRRDFLSGSLGVGAAGALHTTLGPLGSRVRSAPATRAPATAGAGAATKAVTNTKRKVDRALVLCTLYGGNDGLNTVVPYESSAYRQLRGDIAIPGDQVLPLGSVDGLKLGLNPAMVGLKALWEAGQVAIILGTGYPDPNLSHFESMEIMQTADPSGDSPSGWIGRWLDVTGSNPLRALSVGPNVPQVFAGTRQQASTLADSTNPGSQSPGGDPHFTAAYRTLEHPFRREAALEAAVAQAGANLLVVGAKADAALTRQKPPPGISPNDPGDIGNQLDLVAELIKADLPTKAYGVMTGSFDTHMNQLQGQGEMLSQVDAGIQNFMGDFATVGSGLSPVIVIYSEFGRRAQSNASGGTDHGTASNVIVVGPSVKGGFYCEAPSLRRLDENGNLVHTVDFRRVYATVLAEILGVDPKGFLGGRRYPTIPFLP
jgi:uncharacterized protein (DUF1501 family)